MIELAKFLHTGWHGALLCQLHRSAPFVLLTLSLLTSLTCRCPFYTSSVTLACRARKKKGDTDSLPPIILPKQYLGVFLVCVRGKQVGVIVTRDATCASQQAAGPCGQGSSLHGHRVDQ